MTHEQKISYMGIACGVCKYGFTDEQLDLLVSLYELVLKKEGETDVSSIIEVEFDVKKRAEMRTSKGLSTKLSENK